MTTIGAIQAGDPLPSRALLHMPAGPWPDRAPVDLHPALEEVRRMKEFQPPQPGWLDEFFKQPLLQQLGRQLQAFLEQILHGLGKLLRHLKPAGMAHLPENVREVFSLFVGFLLVLLALYTFYLLLGWLLRSREVQSRPTSAETERIFEQGLLVSSGFHFQQARAAAGESRFDNALRQLYLASLCLLDESGLAPYKATQSNREAARQLAGQETLQTDFTQLALQFERNRYGRQNVGEQQYRACEELYGQILASVQGGRA